MSLHFPVFVEPVADGKLWRCAVCGVEQVLDTDTDQEPQFNAASECVGYNPSPG